MILFRSASLAALIVILPMAAYALFLFDVSGCGAAPNGRVLDVKYGGNVYVVLDGELSPGASIDWFIMLDLPSDRTKCLEPGETIRVIDVPSGEDHAKVEVLSGPHKGSSGWVNRDLITPRWHKATIRLAVGVLIVSFFGVLLIAAVKVAVKVIKWVIDDPNAIAAP